MKSLLKKAIDRAVRIDWLWNLLNRTMIPAASYARAARQAQEKRETALAQAPFHSLFTDMTVKHGVFAGMRYPTLKAVGSSLYPKLLGSYEKEIEPLLERLSANPYTEIVVVGCAEGYYAVGLATRIETAKVFAFDVDGEALRLCEEMARLNDVSDRVVTGSFCDAETLKNLPFTKRALILSDCEGYEKQLFTADNLSALARHELLIEVHDFIDIEISSYLRSLFEPTHTIEVYGSIDDIKKAQQYAYAELEGLALATRKKILAERRPAIMEWFYLRPRDPLRQWCTIGA